jgi:hypothetical protein
MDNNLLEFWGNAFLTAAKGQKQAEEFSKMAKNGIWGMPDKSTMVSSFPGMEAFAKVSEEYFKIFTKTNEEIQKSVREFLALMDLVPRKDYLELVDEFENYKKSTEKKSNAGEILGEEMSLQTQGLRNFEELMRDQTKQFQDLMTNFTKLISQTQTSSAPQAEEPRKPGMQKGSQIKKKVLSRGAATKK